jgi:hypothetical protein
MAAVKRRGRRSATAAARTNNQPARLASALAALARGLPNPWDEATDYFRGFTAALPGPNALSPASFRSALGIGQRYAIDMSPADDKLIALGNAGIDWGEDIAGGFRQLGTVMRVTLAERTLAFARGSGVVRVRVWLFGRSDDGTLVGLRSISTEP